MIRFNDFACGQFNCETICDHIEQTDYILCDNIFIFLILSPLFDHTYLYDVWCRFGPWNHTNSLLNIHIETETHAQPGSKPIGLLYSFDSLGFDNGNVTANIFRSLQPFYLKKTTAIVHCMFHWVTLIGFLSIER